VIDAWIVSLATEGSGASQGTGCVKGPNGEAEDLCTGESQLEIHHAFHLCRARRHCRLLMAEYRIGGLLRQISKQVGGKGAVTRERSEGFAAIPHHRAQESQVGCR